MLQDQSGRSSRLGRPTLQSGRTVNAAGFVATQTMLGHAQGVGASGTSDIVVVVVVLGVRCSGWLV
jgi:hypothetical protein